MANDFFESAAFIDLVDLLEKPIVHQAPEFKPGDTIEVLFPDGSWREAELLCIGKEIQIRRAVQVGDAKTIYTVDGRDSEGWFEGRFDSEHVRAKGSANGK